MAGEWKRTTIGEQATLQRGIDITKAQQRPGKIPVVSSAGISSCHDTFHAKGPGVILGRKGTLGTVFYVEEDYWPHDTTLWVRDFHGNDPRFVYFFFQSIASDLIALDVGTANPALNRNHVHPLVIQWPDLDEQCAIARLLGLLDDKIELTHQTNQTLEAMASTTFKSWFVDFDPVIAKTDGRRPYGIKAEVLPFFPQSFVESEIGAIPKGWEILPLGEVLELKRGYDLPKRERNPGSIPIYSSSGISGYHSEVKAKGPGVVTGRCGTIGEVFYVSEDFWPLNTTLYVKDFKGTPPLFIFFLLQTINFEAYSDKAAVPGINRNDVHRELVVVPPRQLQLSFENLVQRLWTRRALNLDESATLSSLRDTLLPKLLSGEIRVKQAEKLLEAV